MHGFIMFIISISFYVLFTRYKVFNLPFGSWSQHSIHWFHCQWQRSIKQRTDKWWNPTCLKQWRQWRRKRQIDSRCYIFFNTNFCFLFSFYAMLKHSFYMHLFNLLNITLFFFISLGRAIMPRDIDLNTSYVDNEASMMD